MAKAISALAKHPGLTHCFRSERFIVTIKVGPIQYKVFQIIFLKSDGTLCVNFPYYKHTEGIVSLVTLNPGTTFPADVCLNDGGKVTSHLVKYSHHPDGRAHFSQDGKVKTLVKKQAQSLEEIEDFVFTVQLQGLQSFEQWDSSITNLPCTTECTALGFSFADKEPESIKFVARYYSQKHLTSRLAGGDWGPFMRGLDPEGKSQPMVLCSTPAGRPREKYHLALIGYPIPRMSQEDESTLTFIGGLDSPETINSSTKPTSFLTLSYPFQGTKKTEELLGSIDLRHS